MVPEITKPIVPIIGFNIKLLYILKNARAARNAADA
jgi:hypothetical protein